MVTAIASGVATILPLVGKIENQKDHERFKTAETLYYAARSGDLDALCQLKYFSGRYGTSPGCGKYGAGTSGFATNVAKQYAFDLYTQAEGILNGTVSPATPTPPQPKPGSAVTPASVGGTLSGVSSVTGAVSSQLGYPNVQEQQRNVFLLAALAVGAFLLVRALAK